MKEILFFDTTLRDGEQAPGNSMNPNEKLEIAKCLDSLGVDIIEIGFPISSQDDFLACQLISKNISRPLLIVFARCSKQDIDKAYDSIKEGVYFGIQLFISVSDIHIENKLKSTQEEVLLSIKEHVLYAKKYFNIIHFALEDALRADRFFLNRVLSLLKELDVQSVNIGDTVGCAYPEDIYSLIIDLKEKFPNQKMGIHCHDDLGLATVNTLAAIKAGIDHVQTTIAGIGERAGNTAFEEVVANLIFKKNIFNRKFNIESQRIPIITEKLFSILKRDIPFEKPIIDVNAFRHEAGIHIDGIRKYPLTYEFVKPEDFGYEREFVFGKHSGKEDKK